MKILKILAYWKLSRSSASRAEVVQIVTFSVILLWNGTHKKNKLTSSSFLTFFHQFTLLEMIKQKQFRTFYLLLIIQMTKSSWKTSTYFSVCKYVDC